MAAAMGPVYTLITLPITTITTTITVCLLVRVTTITITTIILQTLQCIILLYQPILCSHPIHQPV